MKATFFIRMMALGGRVVRSGFFPGGDSRLRKYLKAAFFTCEDGKVNFKPDAPLE